MPFPSEETALKAGKALVEERLAACTNLLRGGTSFFWWEGKVDSQTESILIVKTRQDKLNKAISKILEMHPYNVPAILKIPVLGMPASYRDWFDKELNEQD